MSLKNIVVDGCTLEFQRGGGPNTAISINPNQLSSTTKAGGKAVYNTLKFTVSGYSGQDITIEESGSGSGEIIATATKVKADGKVVILEGDESLEFTITGLKPNPYGSGTVTAYATEVVKVTKAGQDKAKAS